MLGLGEYKAGIATVKLIPWKTIIKFVEGFFKPRVTIIGPEASGKTTLQKVLYNAGTLVHVNDHRRTASIQTKGRLEVDFNNSLGQSKMILRTLSDTPGQRHTTAESVREHISNYKPKVLIIVLDASREFIEEPDRAELDTSQWFGDFIGFAESVGLEGDKFRSALRNVKSVVVMLNKSNKVYDRIWRDKTKKCSRRRLDVLKDIGGTKSLEDLEDKQDKELIQEIENSVSAELNSYFFDAKILIEKLFQCARQTMPIGNIKQIPCCLVKYSDKTNDRFDSGHLQMLDIIRSDLG